MAATYFAGEYIDRSAALRRDTAGIRRAYEQPATRFLPVWEARCLIRHEAGARVSRAELGEYVPQFERAIFLGIEDGTPLFAFALESGEAPKGLGDFGGLRDLISRVPRRDAALLAYARAMVNWHRHHRHCGACGAPNRAEDAGFVLSCSDDACGHRSFPRLDPAIIVLVHRDRHCLLGRQATWPAGRFSTIAGFVEPGEGLEDAVRREVAEETNVRVTHCRYIASQPWPFPASLMIGFHAHGDSEEIRTNDGELAEARWLSREEIAAGRVVLPPRASVAYALIETWFDAVPGPGLASLHREGAFLRPADRPPESG
jgi:NAD+ diphosphatase